jgi:hypothetical protein
MYFILQYYLERVGNFYHFHPSFHMGNFVTFLWKRGGGGVIDFGPKATDGQLVTTMPTVAKHNIA